MQNETSSGFLESTPYSLAGNSILYQRIHVPEVHDDLEDNQYTESGSVLTGFSTE